MGNYGFARVRESEDKWVFEHTCFRKGETASLSSVTRRASKEKDEEKNASATVQEENRPAKRARGARNDAVAESAEDAVVKLDISSANLDSILRYQAHIMQLVGPCASTLSVIGSDDDLWTNVAEPKWDE